jgi:uncharacterized protein YrrD
MEFKEGVHVYTADDKDVGTIDRVVLEPNTNEITHVVVRKGWLFTEDKVVPIRLIDTAVADRVQLRADVEDWDDLPPFEETDYLAPGEVVGDARPVDYAPPLYGYPPVGAAGSGYYTGAYGYPLAPYVAHTEQNIPEGMVGLKEGAKVFSVDGEPVGQVERVYTNDEMNRATHLLVAAGWLFKEKKVIPVAWIRSVSEDDIHLGIATRVLETLPEIQH